MSSLSFAEKLDTISDSYDPLYTEIHVHARLRESLCSASSETIDNLPVRRQKVAGAIAGVNREPNMV